MRNHLELLLDTHTQMYLTHGKSGAPHSSKPSARLTVFMYGECEDYRAEKVHLNVPSHAPCPVLAGSSPKRGVLEVLAISPSGVSQGLSLATLPAHGKD